MKLSQSCLVNSLCTPCQNGAPPLTSKEVNKLFKKLGSEWSLNGTGHLYKEYTFTNFMTPMAFANKIAEIAEAEDHHPDLKISWAMCAVEIWTHIVDGLTENDFILAAKIETAYDKR